MHGVPCARPRLAGNEARKSGSREKRQCDGFVEAEPLIFFLRFNRQNKALSVFVDADIKLVNLHLSVPGELRANM